MRNFARIVPVLLAFNLPLAMAVDPPPNIGSWTLDLARSKYQPASTAPRRETRTYEMVGDSVKLTVRTETAAGEMQVAGTTCKSDGTTCPVSGGPGFDAVTERQANRWEYRFNLLRAGKVVGHISRVTSRDGKTLTETFTITTPSGHRLHHVAVYDRQQ